MYRKGMVMLAVLVLMLISDTSAQTDPPVLDSIISLALENNPGLKATRQKQKSLEYRARAAGTLPDPQLLVAAVNLPHSSFSLSETPMSGVVMGLSQPVPWPGKLNAKGDIARLESEIALLDVEAAENRVIRLVRDSYYRYAYKSRAERLVMLDIDLMRALIEVVDTRYANGKASARDLLRAQTMLSRLENRRDVIHQERRSALLMLNRLTGSESIAPKKIESELPEIRENDFDIRANLDSSPFYREARLEEKSAEAARSLAASNWWPDLMIGIDYRFRENIPGDPVRGEDFLSFKVGLSLPLWFFAKEKNESRAAHERLEMARLQKQDVEIELSQKIADIRLRLETVRSSVNRFDNEIIPRAEAAFEAAQVAYEVDRIDFDGYLNSLTDLLDTELERWRYVMEYHQAVAALEEIVGSGRERKE